MDGRQLAGRWRMRNEWVSAGGTGEALYRNSGQLCVLGGDGRMVRCAGAFTTVDGVHTPTAFALVTKRRESDPKTT